MPTHSIEKTAKADSEKLPDINGTKITYAGGVECQVTVMERSARSHLTAGAMSPWEAARESARADDQDPAPVQAGWRHSLGNRPRSYPSRARSV